MRRACFIAIGAIVGIAWASSLRAVMQQLAGPDSTFTFTGTFGIIIPTGLLVGALLGWAEYQRRVGHQHRLLVLTPLLVGIIPLVRPGALTALLTDGDGLAPVGLAVSAMIGGYSISGRGPTWPRILAGIITFAGIAADYLAPKPDPILSLTTAHGAWFATLTASIGACLTLAASIPMLKPQPVTEDPRQA
jgi:hypothetical protein